jgi:3-hydroxyethyl bacteriochlorophyllide a dehydrogenase
MDALAVILEGPERLALRQLELHAPQASDVVVDIAWSGISTGTEKLLWTGEMPPFPGMGYPLVPGYESVGRITDAGSEVRGRIGEWVFVPGANCFSGARGLFGGTAQRLVVPSARAIPIPETLGQSGVLYSLAATAIHAISGGTAPDLIIGHGVLGRLLARLTLANGHPAPTVWETNPSRREDALGYPVITPDSDGRTDYRAIYDASGDPSIIDVIAPHMAKGSEITLAGFYAERVSFAFPPAFMKEARIRIAAEFTADDLVRTGDLIAAERLNLDGLVSDCAPAERAATAYPKAFSDPDCLKMVLDWSTVQ